MENNTLEIEKVDAIGEEIEASFNFIKEGIRMLNNQKSAILSNHVPLQLLSSGFERLAKILLLLKEKHTTGNYPIIEKKKNYFFQFDNGHGINKMIDELILYAETVQLMNEIPMVIEDLVFIKKDNRFREFLDIITDFSKQQRYYYIDTIVKKEKQENNSFIRFKTLIYSYSKDVDVTTMTYDEEERYILKSIIITVEKGVRAISRFFTHGLGNEGKKHYGDFGGFILMRDEDLGKLKYLAPKIDTQKDYLPLNKTDLQFINIKTYSKTKIICSSDYPNWPFLIDSIEVINYNNGAYCLAQIKDEVFALNGSAVGYLKIPNYSASKYLIPKQNMDLLSIAQKL